MGVRMGIKSDEASNSAEVPERLDHSEGVPTPGLLDAQLDTIASEMHPERNEDTTLAFTGKEGIFGIFDGMGGHAAGDVASREAMDYIARATQERFTGKLSLAQTQTELGNIFDGANERLLELAERDPKLAGMGTTASIVKLWEGPQGERKAVIANVGDSRVYIYRAGYLEQSTLDDNVVTQEIGSGQDNQKVRNLQHKLNNVSDPETLDAEERELFENRNKITHYLGIPEVKPRIYAIDIQKGDKLVLTSDGIHDNLRDDEIAQIVGLSPDNKTAVETLTRSSLARSQEEHPRAKADDMSAIVVEIPA
jgi:serine/threonine protein phosphatase PrpC